jgi:hypothetical protein
MKWNFRKLARGELTRDPIIGEFFSTEIMDNPAQALVRESIQNALDAGRQKLVSIRLFLASGEHGLPAENAEFWLDGAWEHYKAKDNGLRQLPNTEDPCPFLVVEDFGTTGLQGDITQSFPISDKKNSFFYFFRAEGRSVKSDKDRGRWGVGKHVFPRSSRISTLFGLTVRADDNKRLLMGRATLRNHGLDQVHYSPDGYLGKYEDDGFVLPFDDEQITDRFSSDFRLERKNEPGLSVVVPFVDFETISVGNLKRAVVSDYFYPLLAKALVVNIETPDGATIINSETLSDVIQSDTDLVKELLPQIELAKWAILCPEQEIFKLNPCDPRRPAWSNDLIPFDAFKLLKEKLLRGDKIAIRANLYVREKGKQPVASYFDVFLIQDGYDDGRPKFIREGITISDIHAPRSRGVRSMVVVEDKPLATLLGDSENPAHTQWQKGSSNFEYKYVYGLAYIEFVTRFVSCLVNALSAQDEEEDRNILADIFSLPLGEPTDKQKQPKDIHERELKDKSDNGYKDDGNEPNKKRFKVLRARGGFTITQGETGTNPPVKLDIKCAYDIRRGNPLKKYDAALKLGASDFRIGHDGVKITQQVGLKIMERQNNHIRVETLNPEFRLTVKGFDENRDLYVNVKILEGNDD